MATISSSAKVKSISLFICLLLFQFSITKGHGGDDHDGEHADLHEKGLILVKIGCLIILLVSTFAGGVSPYFYRWNESFLLLGTQFAGGVFLATSLIHFLSDANETFSDLTTKTYPFAFMLAAVGYLLTMFGDCLIIYVTSSGEREVKVQVEEGTPAEHSKYEGVESNPAFFRTSSFGDTLLLILALCFHSVFEGIAVGVAGN